MLNNTIINILKPEKITYKMIVIPIIGKYEFPNEQTFNNVFNAFIIENEEAEKKIKFSEPVPVKAVDVPAQYDEEGNVTSEAQMSSGYHIDMAWFLYDVYNDEDEMQPKEHPNGFAEYAIELEDEGAHSFIGVSYLENRI